MSRFNSVWLAAWTVVLVCAGALELTGFIRETFFHAHDLPTLSSILVVLFGVHPLVVATVIIGFLLAIHWKWVEDQLRTLRGIVRHLTGRR